MHEGRGGERKGEARAPCAIALGIVIHLISESNLQSELEVVFSLPVVFLEVTKGYPQLGYQEGPCDFCVRQSGAGFHSGNLAQRGVRKKG